jgi:L-lactate dehydrogenase complex protein LldG
MVPEKPKTMSDARTHILAEIRRNKPAPTPLPDLPHYAHNPEELESRFCVTLNLIGADFIRMEALGDPLTWLQERYGEHARMAVCDPDFGSGNVDAQKDTPLETLNLLDVAVIPGRFGVAENGAVWIEESWLPRRVLPYIAQHLVLTISAQDIVGDLHAAYRRIDQIQGGFGAFIAGPSKTADIEQALVKGAQGPRTAVVVLKGARE